MGKTLQSAQPKEKKSLTTPKKKVAGFLLQVNPGPCKKVKALFSLEEMGKNTMLDLVDMPKEWGCKKHSKNPVQLSKLSSPAFSSH